MTPTAATYNPTNPALFYGGAAVVDYYGADNDNYVAGEGFCCGDNNLRTKSIADDSPNYEKLQYYYHSDHLGSASYITNLDGEVVQHIEYVPFGEVFLEERNNTWNTPFLFNGKELDEETGLYYYGARYYNPRISLWYGVDPLNEERYGLSPYQYCQNNPVILVDPTGLLDDGYTIDDKGNIAWADNTGGENYDVLYLKQEYEMNLENEMNNNPLEYNEPYNKAEVSKGTFSQENIFSLGRTKGVKVTNEDDAKAIYNLVKESSSVEFGIVSGDNNGYMSIIASSGDRGEVDVPRIAQYMIKNGFFILETSHNHPGDTPNTFFPSGFENGKPILPLKHDAEAADWMDKKNGAPIKHYMYHPHSGKTYQYNHRTYVER